MEIFPAHDPDYIGFCDAMPVCLELATYYSGTSPVPETIGQLQWQLDKTAAVVSESNPTGALTNSDLEMAAVVLQN
jgi:hypothetical protein